MWVGCVPCEFHSSVSTGTRQSVSYRTGLALTPAEVRHTPIHAEHKSKGRGRHPGAEQGTETKV